MRFVILILLVVNQALFAQEKKKIQVAVLGTFHFGENEDYVDANFTDLLNPLRQKEIDVLNDKLAKFNPNKIFVENTPDVQAYWNKVYFDWQKGILPNKETEISEVFQIGIKLAAKINNPFGVFCVNYIHPKYILIELRTESVVESKGKCWEGG